MRIVSWNVNGIRAAHRKESFLPMIEKLDPDILCLQETKAEQGQSEIDLPQYEEYWNSAKKKGYSGTAIFTKHKPLSVFFDFPTHITKHFELADGYGDLTSEGRVVTIELPGAYVVTCYTPNAKRDLSRLDVRHKHWDPAFLAYVQELQNKKPVLFCGDLNVAHREIDLARPKENEGLAGYTPEERAGFEAYLTKGFVDTFRMYNTDPGRYTWWSNFNNARARNIGWRIDYIMANKELASRVTHAEIYEELLGSDHCPISIDIDL